MRECVFDNEETAAYAVEKFAEKGWRVACINNAWLPDGLLRYTFLPASAFKDNTASAAEE